MLNMRRILKNTNIISKNIKIISSSIIYYVLKIIIMYDYNFIYFCFTFFLFFSINTDRPNDRSCDAMCASYNIIYNVWYRCEIPVISSSTPLAAVLLTTQGIFIVLHFVIDLYSLRVRGYNNFINFYLLTNKYKFVYYLFN